VSEINLKKLSGKGHVLVPEISKVKKERQRDLKIEPEFFNPFERDNFIFPKYDILKYSTYNRKI